MPCCRTSRPGLAGRVALPEEIRTGLRRPGQDAAAAGVAGNIERLIEARIQAKSNDLYAETLAAMESCLLTRVLRLTEGNQSQAARIPRRSLAAALRNKIHALNIHIGSTVVLDEDPAEDPAEARHVGRGFEACSTASPVRS